ncbi:MAG: geranylgeranylglycerol-phosphate geranylgeranyltransferase [Paludibacteraceae bacterium]|nr:geranylgeranylglycerol-phosphate geranylgeranyltransferase [Paludibacteraceae bacterium]
MKDYLKLIRIPNLVFIAILLWVMEKWVAVPVLGQSLWQEQLPWWLLLLLIVSTVLIAAGGYVINDYFDVKIDRINRPERLIVTRTISKEQAMRFFQILTACGIAMGIAVAVVVRSTTLGLIYVVVPGLLWFYSSSYKRQFIVGNVIVAFASALVPMLIAFANVSYLKHSYGEVVQYSPASHDLYIWLGGFALFAFLCTWIREVIKDLQDQTGDRELECHSMPIKMGETPTKVFVTAMVLLTVGLIAWLAFSILPFSHVWGCLSTRYVVFGLFVPFVCLLWLVWAAKIPSDYRAPQFLAKFIMFLGTLYAYVISVSL